MLTDLIERLEKEGGSRELDALVALATGIVFIEGADPWGRPIYCEKRDGLLVRPGQAHNMLVPELTTSLDAAIALCKQKTETREHFIEVFDKGVDLWLTSGDEDHRTMPKYAVIALLRALEDGK